MFPVLSLLAFLLFLQFTLAADLYKVLDIHKSASEKDIRHAYKKLSRKFHPDKNKDPGAEDKFVEIAHGQRKRPLVYIIYLSRHRQLTRSCPTRLYVSLELSSTSHAEPSP